MLRSAAFASVIFLLSVRASPAQIFPVQATTQISGPYSVFLDDYVAPEMPLARLLLLLKDLREPRYSVTLRLVIRDASRNIVAQTVPHFNPSPIDLLSGVPRWLDAVDLAPYFSLPHLNAPQVAKLGRLKAGGYYFCFSAFDALHGAQLSNESCQLVFATWPAPPQLNFPLSGSELKLTGGV